MDIICRKTNCKFNNAFVCMAKGINISENSACNTFYNKKSSPDTSKTMLKKTPKYHRFRPVKTLNIKCLAQCQFNNCGDCHANGITVNDLDNCPYCITYFKKIKK